MLLPLGLLLLRPRRAEVGGLNRCGNIALSKDPTNVCAKATEVFHNDPRVCRPCAFKELEGKKTKKTAAGAGSKTGGKRKAESGNGKKGKRKKGGEEVEPFNCCLGRKLR